VSILGYFKFNEVDFLKDFYTGRSIALKRSFNGTASLIRTDYQPSDICHGFSGSDLFHEFNTAKDMNGVRLDKRWQPK
jgi:hypothetical protein